MPCPLEQERIRQDKIVLDGEEEDDRKLPKVEKEEEKGKGSRGGSQLRN